MCACEGPIMSVDALLEVRNLKRYFPIRGGLLQRKVATVQAVDDISFEVRRGETLGIVGESGCGKSTTARLLIRLLVPDRGTIAFAGRTVGISGGMGVRDLRRQVQMVFQDSYSSLNPRCTIENTIAFGAQRARPFLGGGQRARPRDPGKGRPRSGSVRDPLSARALGRPAPAGQHRPRACA